MIPRRRAECKCNVFQRFFPVIATTDLAYEMPEKMSVMDTIVNLVRKSDACYTIYLL